MRHVEIHSFIPGAEANHVFDTLADFRHYADLVDVVVSVDVEKDDEDNVRSSWVVKFRNGLLRWTEQDWFRRHKLRLDFNQIEGDFDEFFGGWVLVAEPDGVKASLIVDFDFGVPSLANIVDPVAERVLTDVTKEILRGLFGEQVVFLDPAASKQQELTTA